MKIDNGHKVLIIEDYRLFADILKNYLSEKGYDSVISETGHGGIQLFQEYQPDIVLVDISLPDINGLEVIQKIRTLSEDIPIIVVSGTDDINIAIEAVRRGAWDYILKPVTNFQIFDNTIFKALEKAYFQKKEKGYLERLERHSLAAKKMQERLFPDEKVSWNSYTLSRHIIPSIDTSGDFIDYFLIDDNHFGFYLADVAGHGVAAAFLTIILKSSITLYLKKYHQLQDDTILNPSRILELLNLELLQENYMRHITIFYGVVNMKENSITFANAGLYPFPILFDGRSSSFIEQKGLPLGFVDKTDYDYTTKLLPPTFAILFLSDGILEILQTDDPDAQKNHLLNFIASLGEDENQVLNKINQYIEKQVKREIPDDISFLLIKKSI